MDIKYTVLEKFVINGLIEVEAQKMYIPAGESSDYTSIIIDSSFLESEIALDIQQGENASGEKCYILDFEKEKDVIDRLVGIFMENDSKAMTFSLFIAKGLECHRISDDEKLNLFAKKVMDIEKDGLQLSASIVFMPNGNVNISIAGKKDVYRKIVNVFLSDASQKKNICNISTYSKSNIMFAKDGGIIKKMVMVSQDDERSVDIPVKDSSVVKIDEKDAVCNSFEIDLSKIDGLFTTHWFFYVAVEIKGEEYLVQIACQTKEKKIKNRVLKDGFENPYRGRDQGEIAYININKFGSVRVYTGDRNSTIECSSDMSLEQFMQDKDIAFSKDMPAEIVESKEGVFKVRLKDMTLSGVDEAAVMVYDKITVYVHTVPAKIEDEKKGILSIDASKLKCLCDRPENAFKFAVAIRFGNRFIKSRLFNEQIYINTMIGRYGTSDDENADSSKDNAQDARAIYYDNFFSRKIDDKIFDACPYTNNTGYIMMRIAEKQKLSIYKIVCEALKIHVSNKYITIKAECPGKERNWKGFILSYKYKKEEDKDDRFFEADSITPTEKGCIMSVKIPLADQEFKSTYWSVRTVFEKDGYEYYAAIKAYKQELKESYKKLFQKNCKYYNIGDEKYILFPYVAGNGNINLMFRTSEGNDGFKFRLKERLGLRLFQLFEKPLKEKKIMLVYEKYCYMAQDNGYQFFRYCMENNMEKIMNRKIYYVIDKKSPDYEKVKKYKKNVVNFMSVRFIAYMLAAKLLVSSDVRSHAYAWRHRSSIIAHVIKKKKHIFLQHGVTAMKKVDGIFGKSHGLPTNLFVVTSDAEYEIVNKYFGYNKNEIALTGFARWDVLEDKSKGRREILVMPTWRNWLDDVDSEEFKKSEYYKNYTTLLNSERLDRILKENDVKLNFYIHPKFKDYIGNFNIDAERVHLIPFGTQPLNELMMECNMLITDYSSVSWDVYYMNKPVLFYQFDIDTYLNTHGSYMDMEHDLFGDRTLDVNELIDMIEENIKNNFVMKEKYAREREKNFKYMDRNNCKRICTVIRQKDL